MAATSTPGTHRPAMVIENAGRQRRVVVSKLPFTIGRAEDCDAVIADFRVSRLHAKVIAEDGQHVIVDAGSRHGTFVNGVRCERSLLKNNDQITLGVPGIKISFHFDSLASSAAEMLLRKFSADSVSSEMEKLALFLEAARTLSSGVVVDDVLRNMLDYALRLTKAERGFVYLKGPNTRAELACGRDSAGNTIGEAGDVSHSVIQEAMSTAAEFITGDATQLSALAERQSVVFNELKTVIAIPLRSRRESKTAEVDGVLYLDSRSISRNLSGVSHDVLRALAGECAAVLENARLMEAEQAAKQYRQEMEIAASIQRSLNCDSEVQCSFATVRGRSIPCKEVGGDFFDVFAGEEAITVIVADVSGKGISAALLASVIHGMFHALISNGTSLLSAVTAVNNFLCSRVGGQKYATLLAAQLRKDGRLQIVNCGHVPPVVADDNTTTAVRDGDLPVGLLPQAEFHALEVALPIGAHFYMVTDGITEAEDSSGTEFGLERLEQHAKSKDPVHEILKDVQLFSAHTDAHDDRTLVVLERTH